MSASFLSRHSSPRAALGLLAGSLALAALGGCKSMQSTDRLLGVITPYRIDIVQGNVVTKEQAARIHPGMSRAQVRDILGSPLLTDIFHADRWDYVFTIRRQGAATQSRTVTVLFDGEKLKSIDTGGDLPTEQEFVAAIDTYRTPKSLPPLTLTDAQRKALPPPTTRPPVDAVPDVAARSYPPLEPNP